MALRSLNAMTKGDLCELADIIGATLPRMGTKDAVADAVQKRLEEIKNHGLEKNVEVPPPSESEFLILGNLFAFLILFRFLRYGKRMLSSESTSGPGSDL
jgi:hypothetical protein